MKRVQYIDNLRIFLISLVVLHHLAITYGAPGGWYYHDGGETGEWGRLFLTLFVASNQSYFMGFFFLISAFFTPASMQRKGPRVFVRERLIRLGLPLLIFYFIISPFTAYLSVKYQGNPDLEFWNFFREHRGFGFGPMWFVEVLLYFTLVYLIIALIRKPSTDKSKVKSFPSHLKILLLGVFMGLVSFVVRIWLPIGWELPILSLQLPFFPQYITMLVLGIYAYKYRWFDQLTIKHARPWIIVAIVQILVIFPLMFGVALENGVEIQSFMGGFNQYCLLYSLWEQVLCVAMIVSLSALFRKYFHSQGSFLSNLSDSAYAVYFIHPLVLVSMAILFRNIHIDPFLKFILLAPIALVAVFVTGYLIKRLPFSKRVF